MGKKSKKNKKSSSMIKSRFDPNGSYTGKPLKKEEKPVQDADDL